MKSQTMRFNISDSFAQAVEESIQMNISLASYNTFRFAYCAEYFAIADTLESLKALLQWANHFELPVTMIGGGSNLLITADIPGLVIINRLLGMHAKDRGGNVVTLTVAAGENWHHVVDYAVNKGWFGIENLALIPGTVGAAPVQNIGAYGVEIKDVLARVQVMNTASGDVHWINAQDCGFAYRDSHFKHQWKDTRLITAVELSLKKQGSLTLSYGGLSSLLQPEPTLKEVFQLVCRVRDEKLPDPKKLANAGSFFKNPIVSEAQHADLKERFPTMVSFPFEGKFKLAAGWLIDQAGWKGKQYQGVGVYEKQALVLVNYNDDTAQSLLALETQIQASVFDLYGVLLEREPVRLPSEAVVEDVLI